MTEQIENRLKNNCNKLHVIALMAIYFWVVFSQMIAEKITVDKNCKKQLSKQGMFLYPTPYLSNAKIFFSSTETFVKTSPDQFLEVNANETEINETHI